MARTATGKPQHCDVPFLLRCWVFSSSHLHIMTCTYIALASWQYTPRRTVILPDRASTGVSYQGHYVFGHFQCPDEHNECIQAIHCRMLADVAPSDNQHTPAKNGCCNVDGKLGPLVPSIITRDILPSCDCSTLSYHARLGRQQQGFDRRMEGLELAYLSLDSGSTLSPYLSNLERRNGPVEQRLRPAMTHSIFGK